MFARSASITDRDLIHLELGMPAHDTPDFIKDATITALNEGNVHYSDFAGIALLREALAARVRAANGIDASIENIVVTNGLTHASYAAFMATIDEGDEVILLDPYYPQHTGKIELCGGIPVIAPLDANNNFSINPALIEPFITPRTKAIVLINPCNPTGRVFSWRELSDLGELAIRHDLFVLSDEVYERVLFDGARHISIASLPGMAERTITMFAFTKAYAMDGWRIGYTVASKQLTEAIIKISANMVTHVNTFIQYGAVAAITEGDGAVLNMVENDCAKRNIVTGAMNQMPGVTCKIPEGTIYAFPNIKGTGWKSDDLAEEIFQKTGVVVESGRFYGARGEGHLRICFGAQSNDKLHEAMKRLGRFFSRLS